MEPGTPPSANPPEEDPAQGKSLTRNLRGAPASSSSGRLMRMLQIIETLQSGRVYNSQELATLCGVSRRTVFRDIAELQRAGLQVVQDEARQGYYLPHRLTLPPSELTVPEALSLLLVCQELGGTEGGIPFQSAARSAAQKICRRLPPHIRDYLGEVAGAMSIDLDAHHPLTGAQGHYDLILRALLDRRQLQIEYDAASPEGRQSTILDTYRVIFRRRSWYVVGLSSQHREVRVFHLGRITQAAALTSTYTIPPRFSLERFLGNAWHLIREPSGPRRVVLRFARQVARNVAEVHWHKTQQTEFLEDGRLEFRVTVDGLEEISWWILGYGDQVEVVEPSELREKIGGHALNMLLVYAAADAGPG